MSVYEIDLSGLRVTGVRLTIPLTGAWVADVGLPDDTPLPPGPLTLSIGNLSLVGAVVQQDSIAASREVRLVGGSGGWGLVLPPAGYHDDAVGVVRATVLRDLAALTGEVFAPAELAAATDSLGPDYVREAAPASRTLEQLVGETWWVDPQGLTHILPRVQGVPVATSYLVQDYRGGSGRLVASTEDYASWVPGAVLESPQLDQPVTITNVTIATGVDDRVRVEAMVVPVADAPPGGPSDRIIGVLRALIRQEIRALTFAGVWEYQVSGAQVDASGRTLIDGLPLAPVAALPPLRSVVVRPGVPGSSCVPAPGSLAVVAFLNQDPARPVVLALDSSTPVSLSLSSVPELLPVGAEVGRVVRYGDQVQLAVAGALASGPIIQLATSTPNPISRVSA